MTFEEFYGDDLTMGNIFEFLKKKPYLVKLEQIVMPGNKLTDEDCGKFWELFKEAQKDAFEAGKCFSVM